MSHLNDTRWEALLAGTLTGPEAEGLTRHLGEGCERCEAFLAEREGPDALDGLVDEALLSLRPDASPSRDDLAFARIRRQVAARPRARVLGALGGLAALAAAAALVLIVPGEDGEGRFKGPAAATPGLRLEVLQTTGSGPMPLARGAQVPQGAVVVFQVHLDAPGCVELWREDAGLEPLLEAPVCLEGGAHVLAQDGAVLGLPLDTPGPLFLHLVPAGTPRAHLAAAEAAPGADRFPLRVEPGE